MKSRVALFPVLFLFLLITVYPAFSQVPQSKHVWMITEENHSYESVIGNANMPYFNSLAKKYGLATQYYSDQHSSLPALMWLVAGQAVTLNNNTTSCYNVDNIVRHLLPQGLTWKSYQVDLPYAGFQGLSWLNYVRRHNPLIDFSDACTSTQKIRSVPYPQLSTDMANNATPNYIYISPNLQEDAHNGTLSQADQWLSQNLPAILGRPEFKAGGDGLLFIVFDEGNLSGDNRCSSQISSGCGGRIATVLIGPQVKPAYQSTVLYAHQNLLRTVCDSMGMASCPGAASLANSMSDFFNTVKIVTPFPNAQVSSPVHIQATTSNNSPVSAMQIYVDNVVRYQTSGGSLDTFVPITSGQHFIVVQSWDKAGGIHKRSLAVSVQSQAIVVKTPAPNAVSASPLAVQATGTGSSSTQKMQVYADGTLKYQVSGGAVNTSLSLPLGQHNILVKAWDQAGAVTQNSFGVSVQTPSIAINSPAANASLYSPVQILTSAKDPNPVKTVQLFSDSSLIYQVSGNGISAPVAIGAGAHALTVQATDSAGKVFKKSIPINIKPVIVTVSTPAPNSMVKSPVTIKASVPSASPVYAMQIYVDNAVKYTVNAQTVNTSLGMTSGKHFLVVKAWDIGGSTWTTGFNINVQ